MAEGARLESVFTRKGNVGSNPTLSASLFFLATGPRKRGSFSRFSWRGGVASTVPVWLARVVCDSRRLVDRWPLDSNNRVLARSNIPLTGHSSTIARKRLQCSKTHGASGLRLCPVHEDSKKVENRRQHDSAKRRGEEIELGDDCIAKAKVRSPVQARTTSTREMRCGASRGNRTARQRE